jgi:hypothetical protein
MEAERKLATLAARRARRFLLRLELKPETPPLKKFLTRDIKPERMVE